MARDGGLEWQEERRIWLVLFADRLSHLAQRRMCPLYLTGLIAPGERKSIQPMAQRLGLPSHNSLHHFGVAGATA